MHLLVHKSAQNSSIKDKLWGSLYLTIEGVPKISFNDHLKLYIKVKKDEYDVAAGGLLDCLIGGALECAPRHALNELRKDAHEAVIKL